MMPSTLNAEPSARLAQNGPERGAEYRILGPMQIVSRRGMLSIRGIKQRTLLAILVIHAGAVVSVDRLIDELWGNGPPSRAENAVQAHVARLRSALEDWDPEFARHERLRTQHPGYLLDLSEVKVDAEDFEQLIFRAREVAAGDTVLAAQLFEQALALWRGPALADTLGGVICQSAAARLDESRLVALGGLLAARLALGLHVDAVAELEELVTVHPFREHFWDLLMLALYRSGRHADALQAYHRARRRLTEELGLEPSPTLRERMQAILVHDPALVAPAAPPLTAHPAVLTALQAPRSAVKKQSRPQEQALPRARSTSHQEPLEAEVPQTGHPQPHAVAIPSQTALRYLVQLGTEEAVTFLSGRRDVEDLSGDERQELHQLRREVDVLREELSTLLRATALLARQVRPEGRQRGPRS